MGGRGRGDTRPGDSARNPLPRDLAPGPQVPKEATPSRGRALSAPSPPAALPSFVSREGGLRASQPSPGRLLSFSKTSSGEGGSPVRIRVPPPLPLA